MNIEDYLDKVNKESQSIFKETTKDLTAFGKAHHLSSCIFEFSNCIVDKQEKEMLRTVSGQLEIATLSLGYGFYRQAFSSLRLALEMGFGVVYFSVHKLEHHEWLIGKADIKWSKLTDKEDGLLSKRFAEAFFPSLCEYIGDYNQKALQTYRTLSEFVHGNFETWQKSGIVIKLNNDLISQYFKHYGLVAELLLFVLCCRYLKTLDEKQREQIDFLASELSFITPIREIFGGPKGI